MRARRLPRVARLATFLAFVLAADGAAAAGSGEGSAACAGLQPGPTRTVARIIDGETLALDDGSELRLIGALAPRAIDAGAEPGAWPLEVAAVEELKALVLAKSIDLAFAGERADRNGRLQAHAFWKEGERQRWVQGHLLEQGLARAYVQAGNRGCAAELLDAEEVARRERRGVWAVAAYAVRPANAPLALLRYRSTFQVVEGRIARVGGGRGTIYLNFDGSHIAGRRAFAGLLRRGDRALLGAHAGDPKGLEGKHVRVRGWIERRNGPLVDLSAGGLIEVLEDASAGAAARAKRDRRGRGSQATDAAPQPGTQTKPPDLSETGR